MKVLTCRVRALAVSAVALGGLVALAAPVQATTPRAAAAPTEVTLKAGINDPKDPNIAVLEFLPESFKVATGTTVTWEIAGPEPHSVTFVPPGTAVPPSADQDPSLFSPTPATRSVRRHDARELGRAAARCGDDDPEVLDVVRQDRQLHLLLRAAPEHGRHGAGHRRHAGLAAEDHQGRQRADEEVPRRGRSRQEEAVGREAEVDQELRWFHHVRRRDGHLDRAHRRAGVRTHAAQGEVG